jgi:hypothetical protein
MDAFNDELSSFRERIRGRAKARIEEAIKEYEEVRLSFSRQSCALCLSYMYVTVTLLPVSMSCCEGA